MNTFRDIVYSLQYDLTRNNWIRSGRGSSYLGYILMFHHVTDEHVDINASCQCKVSDFKQIISNYKQAGFEFVSVDDALDIIKNRTKKKFAVVTFDDIPDNVYQNAYPYLKSHSIPFTIFVTVDFVGNNGFVTKDHLLELSRDRLCTIGAHTMTHPLLRRVENSSWEISQSKKELEMIIDKTINCFAYPFGRYSAISKKVKKETENSGFKCAFCTVSAPLTESSSNDFMFLPRIVPNTESINEFHVQWTFGRVILSIFIDAIAKVYAKIRKIV